MTDKSPPPPEGGAGQLRYATNRNHSDPWQRGRRGSLCPKEARPFASDLLNASETDGAKRYAVHNGKAYCAQEDGRGAWHGYPVGWVDVPERLRRKWTADGKVSRRQIHLNWD